MYPIVDKINAEKLTPIHRINADSAIRHYNDGLERAIAIVKAVEGQRLAKIEALRKDTSVAGTARLDEYEEISNRGFNDALDAVLAILNA